MTNYRYSQMSHLIILYQRHKTLKIEQVEQVIDGRRHGQKCNRNITELCYSEIAKNSRKPRRKAVDMTHMVSKIYSIEFP